MRITTAENNEKDQWNNFVENNFPPVGAFMQTWEWGEFQKALGRSIERYFIKEEGKTIASFMVVYHVLPFGLSYGYVPRGPVTASNISEEKTIEVFITIKKWAKSELSKLIFLRLEPPLNLINLKEDSDFYMPAYYIQPRYNIVIQLDKSEDEILSHFHPSTRANLSYAEKRGVIVKKKNIVNEGDYKLFLKMAQDTTRRNRGANAYPSEQYFQFFFKTIPKIHESNNRHGLSLGLFCAYQNNEPAAINFVIYFGDTATYLYGASLSKYWNSKAPTYLHWSAIKDAKKLGYRYYDIGGIDNIRWKKLTDFKKQFRGEELAYIGNIDILINPVYYRIYSLIRLIKK